MRHQYLIAAFVVVLISLLAGCDKENGEAANSPNLAVPASHESTPQRTAAPRRSGDVSTSANVNNNEAAFITQTAPQTPPTYIAPTAVNQEEITVYVTRTGEKYHRGSCRYLRKSRIPISLTDAKRDYGACSVCKPPT
jgi:hypothetical protein